MIILSRHGLEMVRQRGSHHSDAEEDSNLDNHRARS
jgi:predicted RNA binding protein YcfA (HicA-like mRNA interferase family)